MGMATWGSVLSLVENEDFATYGRPKRFGTRSDGPLLGQFPEWPAIYQAALALNLHQPGQKIAEVVEAISRVLCQYYSFGQVRQVPLADVVALLHRVREQPTQACEGATLARGGRDAAQGALGQVNSGQSSPPNGVAQSGLSGVPAAAQGKRTEQSLSEAEEAQILRSLEPAARNAYLVFRLAQSPADKPLKDDEAYELLKETDLPKAANSIAELTDYKLPSFETWTRQLRTARKALGEQKYTRRHGRQAGKSAIKLDQTERP
jgi:hypothetical protein